MQSQIAKVKVKGRVMSNPSYKLWGSSYIEWIPSPASGNEGMRQLGTGRSQREIAGGGAAVVDVMSRDRASRRRTA